MSLEFDRLSEQAALTRHYKIKYKLFSQKKFAIYDEHDLCLYTFRSYLAADTKLTMIEEATGKEIVKTRQQLGHLHLRFLHLRRQREQRAASIDLTDRIIFESQIDDQLCLWRISSQSTG